MEKDKKIPENQSVDDSILTKGGLIEVLQTQTIAEMLERSASEKIRNQLWNSLCFVFASFLAVGGFYLGWAANYKADQAAEYRNYVQRQEVHIDKITMQKMNWMQQVIDAMMDFRLTRFHILLRCLENPPITQQEQDSLRLDARLGISKAFIGARYTFNNIIFEKYREFVELDKGMPNICVPEAPDDDVWRLKMEEIVILMESSISEYITELRKLR